MDARFELWDSINASMVGSYDSQDSALAVVRRALARGGPGVVETLVLTMETQQDDDEDGAETLVVASGNELADLARRPTPLVVEDDARPNLLRKSTVT